jgi:NADH:ubiquinone oxidoreductase subunit
MCLNKIILRFFCKKAGADIYGNVYYYSYKKNSLGKYKRYVIYNGLKESSKVPPLWHAWLHYLTDVVPLQGDLAEKYAWQREYMPNLTGTAYAYAPKAVKNSQVYQSWSPGSLK